MKRDDRYRCGVCRKWFLRSDSLYSCCVIHSAGECCHAFEVQVTKKGWMKPVRQWSVAP